MEKEILAKRDKVVLEITAIAAQTLSSELKIELIEKKIRTHKIELTRMLNDSFKTATV